MSNLFKNKDLKLDNEEVAISEEEFTFKEVVIDALKKSQAVNKEEIRKKVLNEANRKRDEIIENARIEAQEIVKQAENEKKRIVRENFERGYEEGRKEGIKKAKEERREILDGFVGLVESTKKEKYKMFKEMESQMVDLSMEISKRIIGEMLESDEKHFFSMIKRAIEKVASFSDLEARVSEDTYEYIIENRRKDVEKFKSKGISIKVDPSLEANECMLVSEGCEIDLGYESQFDKIQRELKVLIGE